MRGFGWMVLVAALGAAVGAGPAQAQGVAARIGTNGLGLEAGVGFGSFIGVRANYLGGSLSRDDVESGIRYDGKLKLSNGALLLDVHPFAGSFRVSAGMVFNNNKVDATGVGESGTIEINGVPYPAAAVGTLQAAVRWDKSNPYFGLGWGMQPGGSSGLFLTVDLGAFYQSATASLTGSCAPIVPALACQQLLADIQAEQAQFQDAVGDLKWYPVLSIGVGYRF